MGILIKFWNNFKVQPDVWFFYGFLSAFTLSIQKVIICYPIAGQFNEWTGIYLYLSDILLVATLFLWGVSVLRHKSYSLSIDNIKLWLKQAIIWLPLLLVIWSFASICWSENQNIALFKAIKLLELYFLYLYIIYRAVPSRKNQNCSTPERMFHMEHPTGQAWNNFDSRGRRETFLKNTFRIIIVLGLIQAIISIWQFILQHSFGLFWLKESLISPNIAGVAKIVLHGEKFIRAYGLFPHPNILGGFLLFSIILTLTYSKLFRPVNSNFVPCGTKLEHGASVEQSQSYHPELNSVSSPIRFQIVSGMTILVAIQILAFILTFSKSAILGLIIAIIYIFWKNRQLFSRCLTECHSRAGGDPEKFIRFRNMSGMTLILLVIILILSLYLAGLNFSENLEKSYGDRLDQLAIWKSITQNNLLLGVGSDNYMFHVEHNYPNLESWQFQPVHNVFLLILSELGLVGVFIFIWFLWKLFRLTPALSLLRRGGEGEVFKSILLAFIFIMLFDHYLWDIQQGEIMLWMVLGLVAGNRIVKK